MLRKIWKQITKLSDILYIYYLHTIYILSTYYIYTIYILYSILLEYNMKFDVSTRYSSVSFNVLRLQQTMFPFQMLYDSKLLTLK